MSKKVITESVWAKIVGGKIHRCKVTSMSIDGSDDKDFVFYGWNPFPCKSMVSTWHVVQEWLDNNGWNQLPNPVTTIIVEEDEELEIADSPELPEDPKCLYINKETGELGDLTYWIHQSHKDKCRGLLDESKFSEWFWKMLYTHTLEPYAILA